MTAVRISELIAKLQEAMAEHGDLRVAVECPAQSFGDSPVTMLIEGAHVYGADQRDPALVVDCGAEL